MLRRSCVLLPLLLCAALPALASATWTAPTPEELKMTSDPMAPDAPAVYLDREEIVDDRIHFHRLYARIKILTEKGKEEFSDVEIPYEAGVSNIRDIEGRTIHADGTIIPFTGQPYQKELEKAGGVRINAKVFSMPDVQVGSIIEYTWELQYDGMYFMPPEFDIQQPVFVHHSHYRFVPAALGGNEYMTVKDALGKEHTASRLIYYHDLPAGAAVTQDIGGAFDLKVDNVPPLPDEPDAPPLNSFAYRLIFYYSPDATGMEFWKQEGKIWSKDVDRFANPDKVRDILSSIVAPGDTDDQKLHKIYAAVMTIENTSFTREHSAQENKAEGLRVKTAADIWQQKRGTDDEIDRLFLALARAAGFQAWDMIVTERNRNLLNAGYLYWGQLEDEIAIVNIGGKEVFFDPGERDCPYGQLHWMHTQVLGIRQTPGGGIDGVSTPTPNYNDNQVVRSAYLDLAPDGSLTGTVRITMTGAEALRWRQMALSTDPDATKKAFENDLQNRVPDGVHVTMDHFLGLTDGSQALMAVVKVSGSLGTQTGKLVVLPSSFFQANVHPRFVADKREAPIDMHFPYVAQDDVTINLPPQFTVESVPTGAQIPLPHDAAYTVSYTDAKNVYHQQRTMILGQDLYKPADYPPLRDFFQKASAQDQQQIVLKRTAVALAAPSAGAKSE